MFNRSIDVKDMKIFKENNTTDPLECINRAISKLNGLYVIMEYKSKYNRIGVKRDIGEILITIKHLKKEIKRFRRFFNIDKTEEFELIRDKFNKLNEKISEG